jgi:hypothetical protein
MSNGNSVQVMALDSELMARLFQHLSLCSAAGADALLAAGVPGTISLVQWLTDTATGLAQASCAGPLVEGVVLADEDRARIQGLLGDV